MDNNVPVSPDDAINFVLDAYSTLLDRAGYEELNERIKDKLLQLIEDFFYT